MCQYCAESIDFRERGPFSKEAAGRITIVHICKPECTHDPDKPPFDYQPPEPRPRRARRAE